MVIYLFSFQLVVVRIDWYFLSMIIKFTNACLNASESNGIQKDYSKL